MAAALEDRFGGEVPTAMADLVTLPGVGRKTANVVRSVGFGLPGLPVDTHVGRLSRRLGLTAELDPVKVEADLERLVPRPGAGTPQPAPDPARAPGLPGPHAPVRGVPAGRFLPVGGPCPGRCRRPKELTECWARRAPGGRLELFQDVVPSRGRDQVPATWIPMAVNGSRRPDRPTDGALRGAVSRVCQPCR